MSGLWNTFSFIGVAACVCGVTFFCRKIKDRVATKRCDRQQRVNEALREAREQSLDDAVTTLASVGISIYYCDGANKLCDCFYVPKFFWENSGNVEHKAAALITLVKYHARSVDKEDECLNLMLFLARQARKTPGIIMALTHELGRQAGNDKLLKLFFSYLPHADLYLRRYGL